MVPEMNKTKFPEGNLLFTAPENIEGCMDILAWVGKTADAQSCITTVWNLQENELQEIAVTRRVYMTTWGNSLAPAAVCAFSPFIKPPVWVEINPDVAVHELEWINEFKGQKIPAIMDEKDGEYYYYFDWVRQNGPLRRLLKEYVRETTAPEHNFPGYEKMCNDLRGILNDPVFEMAQSITRPVEQKTINGTEYQIQIKVTRKTEEFIDHQQTIIE